MRQFSAPIAGLAGRLNQLTDRQSARVFKEPCRLPLGSGGRLGSMTRAGSGDGPAHDRRVRVIARQGCCGCSGRDGYVKGREPAFRRQGLETAKQLRPHAGGAVKVCDNEQVDREYGPMVEAVCRAPECETGAIAPLVPDGDSARSCSSGPRGVATGKGRPRGKGDLRRDNPRERVGWPDVALQKWSDSGMEGGHALPPRRYPVRARAVAQGTDAAA